MSEDDKKKQLVEDVLRHIQLIGGTDEVVASEMGEKHDTLDEETAKELMKDPGIAGLMQTIENIDGMREPGDSRAKQQIARLLMSLDPKQETKKIKLGEGLRKDIDEFDFYTLEEAKKILDERHKEAKDKGQRMYLRVDAKEKPGALNTPEKYSGIKFRIPKSESIESFAPQKKLERFGKAPKIERKK